MFNTYEIQFLTSRQQSPTKVDYLVDPHGNKNAYFYEFQKRIGFGDDILKQVDFYYHFENIQPKTEYFIDIYTRFVGAENLVISFFDGSNIDGMSESDFIIHADQNKWVNNRIVFKTTYSKEVYIMFGGIFGMKNQGQSVLECQTAGELYLYIPCISSYIKQKEY